MVSYTVFFIKPLFLQSLQSYFFENPLPLQTEHFPVAFISPFLQLLHAYFTTFCSGLN